MSSHDPLFSYSSSSRRIKYFLSRRTVAQPPLCCWSVPIPGLHFSHRHRLHTSFPSDRQIDFYSLPVCSLISAWYPSFLHDSLLNTFPGDLSAPHDYLFRILWAVSLFLRWSVSLAIHPVFGMQYRVARFWIRLCGVGDLFNPPPSHRAAHVSVLESVCVRRTVRTYGRDGLSYSAVLRHFCEQRAEAPVGKSKP